MVYSINHKDHLCNFVNKKNKDRQFQKLPPWFIVFYGYCLSFYRYCHFYGISTLGVRPLVSQPKDYGIVCFFEAKTFEVCRPSLTIVTRSVEVVAYHVPNALYPNDWKSVRYVICERTSKMIQSTLIATQIEPNSDPNRTN